MALPESGSSVALYTSTLAWAIQCNHLIYPMASPPAATPSSSRFKLFSFGRTKSPSATSDAPKDDRSPSIRRETSRSSLRAWQSDESSSTQTLGYTDPTWGVVHYNTTRVHATPSPPPNQESWGCRARTSYPLDTSMHPRNRELPPTFTATPEGPDRNGEMCGNDPSTDDNATHWQRPFHQGCRPEMSPRDDAALETSPNARRQGMIYSPCTPPHHAREGHRTEDPSTEEREINLEDYPWFMCRIIAGVNVKMDLRVQREAYWV